MFAPELFKHLFFFFFFFFFFLESGSRQREFVIYQLREEKKGVKTWYFGQEKIEFSQGKVREESWNFVAD